jgi:hypothetical protein
VAIRASEEEVSVHPYTYRLVCKNGAIHAESIETRQIVDAEFFNPIEAECALRETIQFCCAPGSFRKTAGRMRTSADRQVNLLLVVAPFLSRMRGRERESFMAQVIAQLPPDRRGTRYDLVNLITAAARDTRDPEAKWRLEELGGAVAAGVVPVRPDAAARKRTGLLVPA